MFENSVVLALYLLLFNKYVDYGVEDYGCYYRNDHLFIFSINFKCQHVCDDMFLLKAGCLLPQ